jgi:rhodanese-related sulfurtransferase
MKPLLVLLLLLAPAWAQPVLVPADQIDTVREEKRPFLLDVRNPDEIEKLGTLPGAVNIPLDQLESRLDELPKDRLILTA